MITLKENERLVYVGNAALRAPDGTPLSDVSQYMIVPADEAAPADVSELNSNEQLVLAGQVFKDRRTAEERFAALKEGRKQPPREVGIPLYIKEDLKNVNLKTGLTKTTEKSLEALAQDLLATFARQMRKKKALERQGN